MNEEMKAKLKAFIGQAIYDRDGQMIFGKTGDTPQLIANIRGFGAIQNLFKRKDGSVDFEAAAAFQDALGQLVADAINAYVNADSEIARLKAKLDYFCQAYAQTYKALDAWVRNQPNEDLKRQYFNIIANGTPSPFDTPTYAQLFNTLRHKAEAYEKALENPLIAEETLRFWKGKALYEACEEMHGAIPADTAQPDHQSNPQSPC